jgi:2,4-dienoyl-CoA reductase-like NADH-dependent reductase (Old Yellow Enzyme family)
MRIGKLELPNRLVMPPMANQFATDTGEVTDRLIDHYRQRAPGVGLVIVEHCYVMLTGRLRVHQPGIHEDRLIPGLRRLAQAVQEQGSRIAVQINHAGGKALPDPASGTPVGPSAVPPYNSEAIPRELSLDEVGEIIAAFGQAARRAKEAGFDAVEVHGAHGFLNNQFTSPLTNKRTDRYGGSLENRIRLPLEIVTEVRRQVGESYPVFYRLAATDWLEGGLSIEEGQRIAKALEEASVDVIDVSGGLFGASHPSLAGQGYLVPLAEEMKKVVEVPVIGVGGISEPEFADQVIRQGRVDLVAVGRAILRDPQWGSKAVAALTSE